MKKFIGIYVFFSFLMLGIIYLITIFVITQDRMLDVFNEKANAVIEDRNIEGFLKFQSLGFKHLETYQNDTYEIHLYQILAKQNDVHVNQLTAIVIPLKEIKHANALTDLEDNTSIYLFDLDENRLILDSLANNEQYDYAVSYNIKRIGFYYYAVTLIEDHRLMIIFYDYDQQVMISTELDFSYHAYDGVTYPEGFTAAYSMAQIDLMLDMPTYLRAPMQKNIGIFLIFDAGLGVLLYKIIVDKKKNQTIMLGKK